MEMLNHLSLRRQAELVRSGEARPRDLVAAHLEEIERNNSRINAFAELFAEEAGARAERPLSGPLAGVPLTVKDSFDIAGRRTLCGSALRCDHRATRTAAVVKRLEAAGAIILGKTNTPEFLSNYETDNHVIGRTNNPRNPELTPGGSSGGEAAAIAAFFSAGGVGSDGGGSVRWPAHCCGIAGLKPTPGRVSAAGHFPVIANPGGLMGVAGPMARSAEDVALLFDVLKGYDTEDPYSAPVQPESGPVGVIGVWPQFYQTPVAAPCRKAVDGAAGLLAGAGYRAELFEPRGLERAPNLWSFLFTELPASLTRDFLKGREQEAHWTGTEFLDAIAGRPEPSGRQVMEVLAARDAMRASLLRQMETVPVILTAAAGMTAFPHRQRRYATPEREIGLFQGTFPLLWANLLGLPALVVPMGEAGVQLVGRPYSEELLLDIGMRLEAARDRA